MAMKVVEVYRLRKMKVLSTLTFIVALIYITAYIEKEWLKLVALELTSLIYLYCIHLISSINDDFLMGIINDWLLFIKLLTLDLVGIWLKGYLFLIFYFFKMMIPLRVVIFGSEFGLTNFYFFTDYLVSDNGDEYDDN